MVIEYRPTAADTRKFTPKELVDCQDSGGRWLNAEIVEILAEGLRVHFTGFNKKFDETVPDTPDRVLKQCKDYTGRIGQDFLLNHRVDVQDPYGKWLEARVVEMNEKQIKVHYRNFHEKFDEWLSKKSDRIREIGTYSSAQGIGKIDPQHPSKLAAKQLQPEIKVPQLSENKELRFRQLLAQKNLSIQGVESDGNCQFRSVSHQLYGSTQHHALIRSTVIAYLDLEREYFAQFVIDGLEKFDEYLQYKSKNGAWGDDVELQAVSEIYARPIEIYAYANTPLRTFHEMANGRGPLRLAYHGGSHYNSIISSDFLPLLTTVPGEHEARSLDSTRARSLSRLAHDNEILRSREFFDRESQQDLETALERSLQDSEDPALHDVLQSSMLDATESQMMHQALRESAQEQIPEDDELRRAMEVSMEEQQIHPAILQAMELGFSMEEAIQAVSLVGESPEAVVEYLLSTLK